MSNDTRSNKANKGHFEILEEFPVDVVAVRAHGKIDRDNYENTLIPLIGARVASQGKVHLYYEFSPDFKGFTAGAAWDDARLGLLHLGDFARIAVVADSEWIRLGIKLFGPLLAGHLRLFHLNEADQAKAWFNESPCTAENLGHEVAVERTLPQMEDTIPPW